VQGHQDRHKTYEELTDMDHLNVFSVINWQQPRYNNTNETALHLSPLFQGHAIFAPTYPMARYAALPEKRSGSSNRNYS